MRLVMTSKLGQLPSTLSIPPLHSQLLLDLHGFQLLDGKIDHEFNNAFKEILELYHNRSIRPNSTSKEVHQLISTMMKEAQEITKIQPILTHSITIWTVINWILWVCGIIGIICLIVWIRRRPRIVRELTTVPHYIAGPPPTSDVDARLEM